MHLHSCLLFAGALLLSKSEECSDSKASLQQLVDRLFLITNQYPIDDNDLRSALVLRDQIISHQPANEIFPSNETREMSMSRFVPWAKKHYGAEGIDMIWTAERGMAIFASRDRAPDEVICRFESNYTINAADVAEKYSCIDDEMRTSGESLFITLLLELMAQAIKKDSFFAPYIHALPRSYAQPITFSADDFGVLEGSPILTAAKDSAIYSLWSFATVWKKLNSDPKCASEIGISPEKFALRWYLWAYETAQSRHYNSELEGVFNKVMPPIADLINHRVPSSTTFAGVLKQDYAKEVSRSNFIFQTALPVAKGEELWYQYSDSEMSSEEAFVHYGFNNNKFYALKIHPEQNDPTYSIQRSILDDLEGESVILGNPEVYDKLLHDDFFYALMKMATGELEPSISEIRNLKKTWNFVQKQISISLQGYPNDTEEIESMLEQAKDNEKRTLALNQVLQEVKLLHAAQKAIRKQLLA